MSSSVPGLLIHCYCTGQLSNSGLNIGMKSNKPKFTVQPPRETLHNDELDFPGLCHCPGQVSNTIGSSYVTYPGRRCLRYCLNEDFIGQN